MISKKQDTRMFEAILILITIVLTCILHAVTGYRVIVLNLFYLPVALSAFYLGRYRAGVLAFFSVIVASIVIALNMENFSMESPPLVVGLSMIVWGGVLGLTALLVGTQSDELSSRMTELHEAYVGVVDVLAQYLQSANPRLKDRSRRIAELCEDVARQMRLPQKQVDDIRVAALLQDIENIEITARVIQRAMGEMADEQKSNAQHTFHGTELVHSLGPVLWGAVPLMLNQADADRQHAAQGLTHSDQIPLGARIIRTVRAYDALLHAQWSLPDTSPADVIRDLRRDAEAHHDPTILQALERSVSQKHDRQDALVSAAVGTESKTVAVH